MRSKVPVLVVALVFLVACGDGGESGDGATPTSPAAACPGSSDQYTGPTSEGLCATVERDASGDISLLEVEIMASCSVGFGESDVVLGSVTGTETVTTTDASSNPNEPFEATVSFETPISVETDGALETTDNLSGTISDTEATGSYELQLATFLGVQALTCRGGPVTWTASRSA
jgi:hypothetical protein